MLRFLLLLCVCPPLFAARPVAGPKSSGLNGSVETGFIFGGPPRDSQWLVDQLEWNQRFDASDRVHFIFNNAVSVFSPTGLSTFHNSSTYFSQARLSGTGFTVANAGAYLQTRLSDRAVLSVGHFRIPFGSESIQSRYDSPMYFYSGTFAQAQSNQWLWAMGLHAEFTRVIPGQLTVALVDGRRAAGEGSPALALRYEYTWDRAGFSLIPSFSTYLGKWESGTLRDVGLTAGLQWMMGTFALNLEYLYAKSLAESSSFYLEPTLDLGIVEAGAKAEWQNTSGVSDFHVGVGLTKNFQERLRLRVLYQASGLSGRIRANGHELRVLLGTHW